jgi:hypothetical protein
MQGTALHFRPFVIGAVICWLMALIGLFIESFDWVMVIHATAVLLDISFRGIWRIAISKNPDLWPIIPQQFSV